MSKNDLLSSLGKMNGGKKEQSMEEALLEALMGGAEMDLGDLMEGFDEEAMEK